VASWGGIGSCLSRRDQRGTRGADAGAALVAASLGRRLLAALIDLIAFLAGLAASALSVAVLANAGVLAWLGRSRPARHAGRRISERLAREDVGVPGPSPLESTRGRLALYAFGLTTAVWSRNLRGPGYRVLGLRRVDALTGGPVGIRAALVRHLVEQSRSALLARILAPIKRQDQARRREATTEMRRLISEHTGDPQPLLTAMNEQRIRPRSSCLWALPKLLATYATDAATLSGPDKRSLADKLARTIVTIDK
jgi:uncharacterized RDD family membrane protein YckC